MRPVCVAIKDHTADVTSGRADVVPRAIARWHAWLDECEDVGMDCGTARAVLDDLHLTLMLAGVVTE